MSDPKSLPTQDPLADYRKYPKSPNFLGIVLGACAFMLVAFVAIYLFLHKDAGKVAPHNANPAPNSLVQPSLTKPDLNVYALS